MAHPGAGTHDPASPWVQRWTAAIRPGGRVLDVACGGGRHVVLLARQGFDVTAVDRDAAALAPLSVVARTVVADLEGAPWPLPGERFDAVVVTNYLWRPLWPSLLASLADGGLLVYETFGVGQADVGKPSNPAFLLKPGELLQACAGLHVLAYEDGWLAGATAPRCVQRIAAVRAPAGGVGRYTLG